MKNTRPTKAVIYCRFSPRRNADECESCEKQLEKCRQYCQLHDLEIVDSFKDEALSGVSMNNRPGLQQALELACKEKAALVVFSLSRLARNTREALGIVERLNKANAHFVSFSEDLNTATKTGRFIFTVFAGLAQMEREIIAERTKEAMLRHQENGKSMSDLPPYGYIKDPDNPRLLIENHYEQQIIQRIVQLRKEGRGLREICRELQKQGYQPRATLIRDENGQIVGKREGRWHHQKIKNILRRANQQ